MSPVPLPAVHSCMPDSSCRPLPSPTLAAARQEAKPTPSTSPTATPTPSASASTSAGARTTLDQTLLRGPAGTGGFVQLISGAGEPHTVRTDLGTPAKAGRETRRTAAADLLAT